jgi:hypothetical protein
MGRWHRKVSPTDNRVVISIFQFLTPSWGGGLKNTLKIRFCAHLRTIPWRRTERGTIHLNSRRRLQALCRFCESSLRQTGTEHLNCSGCVAHRRWAVASASSTKKSPAQSYYTSTSTSLEKSLRNTIYADLCRFRVIMPALPQTM